MGQSQKVVDKSEGKTMKIFDAPGLVPVRFLRTYKGRYFKGDVAGFTPDQAKHLVSLKAAVFVPRKERA